METLTVPTKSKDEVVDITERVASYVQAGNQAEGVCVVFCGHTTCAVTATDLDPGTDLDLLQAFRAMVPKLQYRHPHDPAHTPDHILTALLGPSVSVPFANRQLLLGTWQRIVLVEFDGPRQRTIQVTIT